MRAALSIEQASYAQDDRLLREGGRDSEEEAMRRTAVMSSMGLPLVATRSACMPGTIVPIRLLMRRDSAAREVALTIASMGA